jgi:hypothetical protein
MLKNSQNLPPPNSVKLIEKIVYFYLYKGRGFNIVAQHQKYRITHTYYIRLTEHRQLVRLEQHTSHADRTDIHTDRQTERHTRH